MNPAHSTRIRRCLTAIQEAQRWTCQIVNKKPRSESSSHTIILSNTLFI